MSYPQRERPRAVRRRDAGGHGRSDQLTEGHPGYVTVVPVETYWVLTKAYKVDQGSVGAIVRGLTGSSEVIVEQADDVRRALRRVDEGADFADALIYELGATAGCDTTMTFDRNAAKSAGMRLLEQPAPPR